MTMYKIPYGVALVFGSLSGKHFIVDESYACRPDLIVEAVFGMSAEREVGYNSLSNVSPLTLTPGAMYHIPSEIFHSLFKEGK